MLRVAGVTADGREALLGRLRSAAPELFADGQIDLGRLKDLLGQSATDSQEPRAEPYALNWPGKREAMAMLQAPIAAALHPDPASSVNWDTAAHVFIEGENLSVLKLLHDAYFGAVKLIYIDPPYNTASDLIYKDDFRDPKRAYLIQTGQMTEDGSLTTSTPDAGGRRHSNWLSMMYPRLSLARQLLAEKGLIMISINDVEAPNLRRLCDEVFGDENFVAQMVWEKGRKNDAKLISVGHEYIIIYARNLAALKEANTIWREEKPGAREIWDHYLKLRAEYGDNDKVVEVALQKWFADLPKSHPSRKWSRYKRVDKNGPWRDRDISWPGGDGPKYEVIHRVTGKPCAVPERGWIYPDPEKMERMIDLGLVEFRADHTEPPFRKAHIRPVAEELSDEEEVDGDQLEEAPDEKNPDPETELATQVRGSYFYKQSQSSVKHLRSLMGSKVFDNPKDHEELMRLFKYVNADCPNPLILDFFAGSGTTGEAVLRMAANGHPGARFIAVQAPEQVSAKEKSGKNAVAKGWHTISDITRERLRKVCEALPGEPGFRAFRFGDSQLKPWTGVADASEQGYLAGMKAMVESSFLPGWTPEGVMWEVALRERLFLTSKVQAVAAGGLKAVWRVADEESGRVLTVCLDDVISLADAKALGLSQNQVFICRDSAMDDTVAANLALQCTLKVL